MKPTFFARWALIILVVIFFLVPFALRGARFSLQQMKNDVKDWLPADFAETEDLDWFREHFLGEQFVVASWPGCTEDSVEFQTLKRKLTVPEIPPSQQNRNSDNSTDSSDAAEESDTFIGDQLGLYTTGDYHENWCGKEERWLKGLGDQWYFITPAGDLYHWEGGDSHIQGLIRTIRRATTGTNKFQGRLIKAFNPLDGPWYYKDPRRLTAKLIKTVTTGPDVYQQLTSEGGALENDPEEAISRLSGTLFGPDGKQTCLVLTLTDVAKADLRRVVGREILGQPQGKLLNIAQESGLKLADLKLGGPPVDNVAIDEEGQITLVRLVGFCIALGVGLSYLCFRSIKATIMVFFAGGVSAITSLAIVFWSGSVMDAILMSMPSVVYVLGLSGAVHVVNYYRDAVRENGIYGAPEKAFAIGWKPCALATVTTGIGLLSLYTSEILPIRKFGFFSAIGVLASLVLLFSYLPAALQTWPLSTEKKKSTLSHSGAIPSLAARFWKPIGNNIIRYNVPVCIGCIIVLAAIGFGLTKIDTSVHLLKMFDGQSKIIQDYQWLETNLGKLVPMEVVLRVDPKMVKPTREELALLDDDAKKETPFPLNALDRMELTARVHQVIEEEFGTAGSADVGRAMSATTFVQPLPGIYDFTERLVFASSIENNYQDLLGSDYLRQDKKDQSELWRISLRLGALDDIDYGQFVDKLKTAVEPIMAAYYYRDKILRSLSKSGKPIQNSKIFILGSPYKKYDEKSKLDEEIEKNDSIDTTKIFALTLRNLMRSVRLRISYLDQETTQFPKDTFTSKKWAATLQSKDCVVVVRDHPDYDIENIKKLAGNVIDAREHKTVPKQISADSTEQLAGVSAVYTGVVPLVYKAQRTLLESLQESIGWAFVLIGFVMVILLRSPTAGLFSMIPNVFPVVIIFGAMGWLGIAVDIGSMMTASVAMGVAVDDTIHFLTWFRRGLDKGIPRKNAIMLAYEKVAVAMFQTTLIGGLGLFIFALSTFTPTQRFGSLMLVLLMAALVGDLIFLPALLAGPVGRVFRPRHSKSKKEKDSASSNETPKQTSSEDHFAEPHSTKNQAKSSNIIRHDNPHRSG